MTGYTQLTQVERYQIHALRRTGLTLGCIAGELERHISTISRELQRNSEASGYCPDRAQGLALQRRRAKARPRITGQTWSLAGQRRDRRHGATGVFQQ